MTDEEKKARAKRFRRRAAIAGVVIALACKTLPPDYQDVCQAIASLCTGGF